MSDDLVKRLRTWARECDEQHGPGMWSQDMQLAAIRIEETERQMLQRMGQVREVFTMIGREMNAVRQVMEAFSDD